MKIILRWFNLKNSRVKVRNKSIEPLKCTKHYVFRMKTVMPSNDTSRVLFQTQDKVLVLCLGLKECFSWCHYELVLLVEFPINKALRLNYITLRLEPDHFCKLTCLQSVPFNGHLFFEQKPWIQVNKTNSKKLQCVLNNTNTSAHCINLNLPNLFLYVANATVTKD